MEIGCVIVTFNKVELLKECISAILNQSVPVDKIILVDNCSTDETEVYAKNLEKENENLHYYRLDQNIGGAGGFNFGLKQAYSLGMDYIWMMDNDTIPKNDALENLCKHIGILKWGFLCSNVRWVDGTACLMNVPSISKNWNELTQLGVIRVNSASFVSLLISKEVIEEVGYPISDFFIWGDDFEFTSRITKAFPGYLVTNSEVIHKMDSNQGTDIIREKKGRIDRYYFARRNTGYIARKNGFISQFGNLLKTLYLLCEILFVKNDNKFKKIGVVIRGYISGLFFNPKVEFTKNISND